MLQAWISYEAIVVIEQYLKDSELYQAQLLRYVF